MTTLDIRPLTNGKLKEEIKIPQELRVLNDGEQPCRNTGVFRIVHPEKGDERIVWDSGVLAEIQAAKKLFTQLIKKGLAPYKVGVDGKKTSEMMKEFDPSAEEVIFLPTAMIAGG